MKTLIVMPSASCHGGAEAALMHLLRKRADANLEIRVIYLEDGEMVGLTKDLGVEAEVVPAGRLRSLATFFRTVGAIRKIIHAWQPAVVLGWMTKAHIYSGLAARGTKAAATYFQMGLPDGGFVDRLARLVPAAGALGCSEFVAREQGAKVRHPVLGVALAADVSGKGTVASTGELKQRLGFDPNRPLIGIVGRLQHWKGMHVYLKALARVVQVRPGVQGVIVGGKHDLEPDYPALLERVRQESGLVDIVRMAGKQTNVPEWMGAMDIVIHASEREPFGIVVIEAMALGKTVIATAPGGPEEIIRPGEDGLLVPWNNDQALAESMLRCLDDPAWAARMALNAVRSSHEYTMDRYAARVGAALRKLMACQVGASAAEPKPATVQTISPLAS